MELWSTGRLRHVSDEAAEGQLVISNSDHANTRNLHWRNQKQAQERAVVFQWTLEKDTAIPQPRTQKWKFLMTMIDKCGSYATTLVRVVIASTRKHTTSMGLRFLALDLDAYGALFGSEDAFGALDMFVYDFVGTESQGQARAEVDESVRVEPEARVKVHEVADVLNFSALTRGLEMGEHETGERRPDELRKLIDYILEQGSPVSVADGEVRPAQESSYGQ